MNACDFRILILCVDVRIFHMLWDIHGCTFEGSCAEALFVDASST